MRGGLDDALARMDRMEELRHRTSDQPATPGTVVEELVQAARRAVGRDGELAITVTVEYRGRMSVVRVQNQDGEVTVTVVPAPPERPRNVAPAPPPATPPSAASQLAELLRQSEPD